MIIRYNIQIGAVVDNAYIDVSNEDIEMIKFRLIEMLDGKLITEEQYKQYLIKLKLEKLEQDF